ncbi:hypothetical protein GIB67_014996 [Kingdonia uniflora]|uniref:Uncharacterized protein n=1 Tax=Kingdonia uniflora TaxID=39325 RepID=A0A7J7MTR6_9MAGN|nr:hypothetical protein GIB67_014996 [Kingdonia uniflora]
MDSEEEKMYGEGCSSPKATRYITSDEEEEKDDVSGGADNDSDESESDTELEEKEDPELDGDKKDGSDEDEGSDDDGDDGWEAGDEDEGNDNDDDDDGGDMAGWYEIQDLHVAEALPQMVALSEVYMQKYEKQQWRSRIKFRGLGTICYPFP